MADRESNLSSRLGKVRGFYERPEDFAAYIKSEIPKWTAIVKVSGATLE